MQTVYKYDVPANEEFTLNLPIGARVLRAKLWGQKIFLWALIDRDAPREERRFLPITVGQNIPDGYSVQYIDSFVVDRPPLSCHFFEVTEVNGQSLP